MKRVLTFLALMLLPLSVMAMTPVSDSTLSDVTGQAGVNINADLRMNITLGTVAWGDSNGIDPIFAKSRWNTGSTGGYVGVNNFNIQNLRIKARETDTYGNTAIYNTNGAYTTAGHYTTANLKPITIDVATGGSHPGITYVRFGLGSLEITMDAMSLQVALGAYNSGYPTLNQVLGTANLGSMGIYINPGSYVDIYTAANVGVNMNFYVVIDQFNMNYLSWGDTDGTTNPGMGLENWMGSNGAGYVGLENLKVGAILLTGTVRIDVNSATSGSYIAHLIENPGFETRTSVSVVHIGFTDNFMLRVLGPIKANVKVGNVAALNGSECDTLGDIYITGFTLNIIDGSWVDIWAH